jgi:hypothetical protein
MKNLKLATILVIITLIILTIITVCLIAKNFSLVKETFLSSNHNCYPYSSVLNARLSFSSPSKGWCTTGDYPELKSDDDFSDSKKSSDCGGDNYYRIKGDESVKLDSKSWCKSAN